SPYDSAKVFVQRHCIKEGALVLHSYQGEWWGWNGRCYERVKDETINKLTWNFLDTAKSGTFGDSSRFLPKPADVEGLIKGLRARITTELHPPCWADGTPAPNLLVFRNGLVDIETGEMSPLNPRLWVHHELDFEFDPDAKCEFWDQWLEEVFP